MKVILAQINTTPRDFAGNFGKIHQGLVKAGEESADLAVFPELCIPGYLSKDMMYHNGYIEQNLEHLELIREATKNVCPKTHVIVGYIDRNTSGTGKPFRNMAAVIRNGNITHRYAKQLLPYYDVFDEGRYFEPGNELCVVEICGMKWGICICEDLWNDKGEPTYDYNHNPLQKYRNIGVRNIISINSSPWYEGKECDRMEKLLQSSADSGNTMQHGTIIYVNQIGGQDELVFDGNSFIARSGGLVYQPLHRTEFGEDSYALVGEADFGGGFGRFERPPTYMMIRQALVVGLRDYVRKSGFQEVVVSSSGGIDSAVVLALCCEALGPKNVHAIRQPGIHSSEHSLEDATQLHQNLGCWEYTVPLDHMSLLKYINGSFENSVGHLSPGGCNLDNLVGANTANDTYNDVADENIQARLRGVVAMHFSNAHGALPITTGNKTELATGFCTLYGDMNGGFALINDLYKMQVYELAKWINNNPVSNREIIPHNIINKAPSAELAIGQKDEDNLLPYPILDTIVKAYIENFICRFDDFVEWLCKEEQHSSLDDAEYNCYRETYRTVENLKKTEYDRMIRLIDINEFKRRQAAPGVKIHPVAFGTGRRIPIVKGM